MIPALIIFICSSCCGQLLAADRVVVIPLNSAKKLKNVVTVSARGGDFTDPVAAMDSITNAGKNNPYLVIIGPGVYTLSSRLVMKEYVDVSGSGKKVTQLVGMFSSESFDSGEAAVVQLANNSMLSNLSVSNTGGGNYSYGVFGDDLQNCELYRLAIQATGGTEKNEGVYSRYARSTVRIREVTAVASGGKSNVAINSNNDTVMSDITATASGGSSENVGVLTEGYDVTMTDVRATASGGEYSRAVMSSSTGAMAGIDATASGATVCNVGVYLGSGYIKLNQIHAEASGANGADNYGIEVWGNAGDLWAITDVTATASGGTNSYGIYSHGVWKLRIRRSTLSCGGYASNECKSLFTGNWGPTNKIYISQSSLSDEVSGLGQKYCVACDNGQGTALDASCQ